MELIIGFMTGLALVMPVGPIAVAIVGVGATAGRGPALRAASGVAMADVVLMVLAFAGGGALLAVSPDVLATVQLVIGVLLIGVGLLLVVRAGRAVEATASVRHPATALFLGTVGNPLTLALWLGIATAAPYAGNSSGRMLFFAGLILATVAWHTVLAIGGSALEGRLSPAKMTWGARLGGVVVATVGVLALVLGGAW